SGSKKSGSETSPTSDSDSDTDAQPPAEETERTEAPDDAPASDTVPAASDDEKETRDEALQRLFDDASRERDEGDLARAVELFQQALKTIPSEQHEARASVLFLLVDVLRSAVTVEDEPGYLCVAERDLLVFLEGVRRDYGPEGDELRDVQKAKALLEEVRALLARASEEHPELDCEDPFGDAPAPARDDETARLRAALRAETEREAARRRTMLIAGATTTGIGVAALGVMTAGLVIGALAERDGQALVDDALVMGAPLPERDPALLELERRGQTGNLIAIAGGVAGAVALGVGVPLLVAGAKKPAEPLVSLLPLLSRRGVGASLTLRF
ncbi:MAG: hypothetical protein KC468_07945, partial [Myxococcales bacterium]|nr:hypothetical protein [Myxococcales bacterium]